MCKMRRALGHVQSGSATSACACSFLVLFLLLYVLGSAPCTPPEPRPPPPFPIAMWGARRRQRDGQMVWAFWTRGCATPPTDIFGIQLRGRGGWRGQFRRGNLGIWEFPRTVHNKPKLQNSVREKFCTYLDDEVSPRNFSLLHLPRPRLYLSEIMFGKAAVPSRGEHVETVPRAPPAATGGHQGRSKGSASASAPEYWRPGHPPALEHRGPQRGSPEGAWSAPAHRQRQ